MRQLHLVLALMLALPLQGLASSFVHDCAPQAAGTMAQADHVMAMSGADGTHDCCDEEGSCPAPNACSTPAGAAVPVTHSAGICPACRDQYLPGPASFPQAAHLIPLNRPPIAS